MDFPRLAVSWRCRFWRNEWTSYARSHECQSARYAGWAGLKNGGLLSAAEGAGFEAARTRRASSA